MHDIMIYNDVKNRLIKHLGRLYSWNEADIKLGAANSNSIELEKQNAYIEYLASIIAEIPMPD